MKKTEDSLHRLERAFLEARSKSPVVDHSSPTAIRTGKESPSVQGFEMLPAKWANPMNKPSDWSGNWKARPQEFKLYSGKTGKALNKYKK